MHFLGNVRRLLFLSTLSLRRATAGRTQPAGGLMLFLSTLSLRRATGIQSGAQQATAISIHALLAESDVGQKRLRQKLAISIHALLAESDLYTSLSANGHTNFYPRSPCGERLAPCQLWHGVFLFLSTLSLRRATLYLDTVSALATISIHALLAESDHATIKTIQDNTISIHALLAESDAIPTCGARPRRYFYPRSPCGERLYDTYAKVLRVNISIHALLAESDAKIPFAVSELVLISIHALLAESDAFAVWVSVLVGLFLSTLSLRRATGVPGPAGQHSFDFYPRSPCGERP